MAEVALNVCDLPRMRRFYEEVLGFPLLYQGCHEDGPEPDPAGEPTIAFLTIAEADTPLGRRGHPQILALIDYRRHAFVAGAGSAATSRRPRPSTTWRSRFPPTATRPSGPA